MPLPDRWEDNDEVMIVVFMVMVVVMVFVMAMGGSYADKGGVASYAATPLSGGEQPLPADFSVGAEDDGLHGDGGDGDDRGPGRDRS